ncbi:MAG TPA: hypothetical protein VHM19_21630, partial [Polyangiales bacterium]|nr:hypothetical protein [Polyangiales bacterium]
MHDTTPSLRDLWARAVEPVAAVTDAAEREQARLLASMLLVLLVLGALSCVVQLALVDGFFPTFRFIAGALLGVAGAYALSRTPRFRIAVWLAALFVIAACTATGLRDPNDHVWYAFALIAVLLGSTFLELRAAMALCLATLVAVAFTLAHTSTSQSAAALVAPVMIHLVVSPLVLVLSRHRAKVEALRSELLRRREQQLFETRHLAALGRLASQTAHDFNNVLTVVLGNSAAMISSRRFEAAPLEEIQLAGQQAARLSRQLVAFASDQPPALQPLNLRNV